MSNAPLALTFTGLGLLGARGEVEDWPQLHSQIFFPKVRKVSAHRQHAKRGVDGWSVKSMTDVTAMPLLDVLLNTVWNMRFVLKYVGYIKASSFSVYWVDFWNSSPAELRPQTDVENEQVRNTAWKTAKSAITDDWLFNLYTHRQLAGHTGKHMLFKRFKFCHF